MYSPPNNSYSNTNADNNPLYTNEHTHNQINSLQQSVDGLAGRVTKLEISSISASASRTRSLSEEERKLCYFIIEVLRKNGNRFKKGKALATKVRALAKTQLETKVVNNLLYTVLEVAGIIQLQGDEWVLIDEEKVEQMFR